MDNLEKLDAEYFQVKEQLWKLHETVTCLQRKIKYIRKKDCPFTMGQILRHKILPCLGLVVRRAFDELGNVDYLDVKFFDIETLQVKHVSRRYPQGEWQAGETPAWNLAGTTTKILGKELEVLQAATEEEARPLNFLLQVKGKTL